MKWLLVPVALIALGATAVAAEPGLEMVRELGSLNGRALACVQQENIGRIKQIMIAHAPKTRAYGAAFEESTQEAFLARSAEPQNCTDAALIALQADGLAERLRGLFAAGGKGQ